LNNTYRSRTQKLTVELCQKYISTEITGLNSPVILVTDKLAFTVDSHLVTNYSYFRNLLVLDYPLSEQGTATINQKFGCNTYNGTEQGKECTLGKSAVQDTSDAEKVTIRY
jgi:hypothetical protein